MSCIIFSVHFTETSKNRRELTYLQDIRPTSVDVSDVKRYRVTGLAILDNELFVSSNSNVVEVHDLRTLKFKRRWRAEEVQAVVDMKASVRNKCLYLSCSCKSIIHVRGKRVTYSFLVPTIDEARLLIYDVEGIVDSQWKPDIGNIQNAQISVTGKSNVLVTNGAESKFTEYSSDGEEIRDISLKWESGIEHLMQ